MSTPAEQVLGYRFVNPNILDEALTHASIADTRQESNERLEFLGDAILGYVVCEYLFEHFPDFMEGELTKIKSAVVSRRVCAKMSREINLCSMLSLGKGMAERQEVPKSVSAAVYESVIAAMYLDGGIDPARDFILRTITPHIEEAAGSTHQQNFKSVLQQYAQKYLPRNPMYVLLDEKGPDHAKAFEVCVEIEGHQHPSAWANSKKEAEQAAAKLALTEIGVLIHDEDGVLMLAEEFPEPEAAEEDAPLPD